MPLVYLKLFPVCLSNQVQTLILPHHSNQKFMMSTRRLLHLWWPPRFSSDPLPADHCPHLQLIEQLYSKSLRYALCSRQTVFCHQLVIICLWISCVFLCWALIFHFLNKHLCSFQGSRLYSACLSGKATQQLDNKSMLFYSTVCALWSLSKTS